MSDDKRPFKKPRLSRTAADVSNMCIKDESSSDSDDTVDSGDGWDEEVEFLAEEAIKSWLSLHGPKLFALEASKYLARKQKLDSKR